MKVNKPTLVIDEQKCKANIDRMLNKAKKNGLKFRPHFKTHQSRAVGMWFKDKGVEAITVSSLGMASYFEEAGWKEITVAFPLNVLQMDQINELAGRVKLNLLIDNVEVVNIASSQLSHNVFIYIEIDSGAGRTGARFDDVEVIREIAEAVNRSEKLSLKGVYTHAGHSYQARSKEEILKVFNLTRSRIISAKEQIEDLSANLEVCIGDTPTCSVATDFEGIDAISPGNFVFYDLMQTSIGACSLSDIAVAMACPVVSKNKHTQEVCVYGGAVHFSKDSEEWEGKTIYGKVARSDERGWGEPLKDCYIKSLSQEHGIVKLTSIEFERIKIGDTLTVLPVHSCLTAEAMGYYLTSNGDFIDHYAQKNRDEPG